MPKYTAHQIYLSLDKYGADWTPPVPTVDEFGITTNMRKFVERVENKASSKKVHNKSDPKKGSTNGFQPNRELVPYTLTLIQTLKLQMRSL